MRVTLVLPWMGGGGVERVRLHLMNGLLEAGHEVDLVLTEEGGNFMHLVPPAVHVELFGRPRIRHTIADLRRYMRRRRPDVMQVAMWPLTIAALIARTGLRGAPAIVTSDHNVLTVEYDGGWRSRAFLAASVRLFYPRADAVLGVSTPIADDLAALSGMARADVRVIHNPTPAPLRTDYPRAETDLLWRGHSGPRFITAGRMKAQKNHALLIDAFAAIAEKLDATLAILGEGELEAETKAKIAAMGLQERVITPGFVVDPGPWYASANQFVLSSDYEGFGNVLVEAMHFGLSVVSTDCPGGPAEILDRGRFGRLVPVGDAGALAAAMAETLRTPFAAEEVKARAAHFNVPTATAQYLALFEQALAARG